MNLEKDERDLPQETRLALFRIYQQSISNVLQHSAAQNVTVWLQLNDQAIHLKIHDDGKGFDPPPKMLDLLREGHYGLARMVERAETLGGHLSIETQPKQGTLIEVSVPRETAGTRE